MKRFLLSLMVLGGLALMAASQANATTCGLLASKSFAVNIEGVEYFNGSQPSVGAVPNAISALGSVQVDSGCAVHGELLYNDNGTVQGPSYCTPGGESLIYLPPTVSPLSISGVVPCFDGSTSTVTGTATLSAAGQGQITITDTPLVCISSVSVGPPHYFACTPSAVTMVFNISEGTGAATFSGISQPDDTQATTPPILGIYAQHQTTPYATTFGTAPWVGETTTLADGAGGGAASSTTCPGCGSGNSGYNQIFPGVTGEGGGSLVYNSNNDFLNTVAKVLPGDDCHYNLNEQQLHTGPAIAGPYADGTLNVAAIFAQPFTGACGYANIGAGFSLSAVLNSTALSASALAMETGNSSALSAVPGLYGGPGGTGVLTLAPASSSVATNPASNVLTPDYPSVTYGAGPYLYPLKYGNKSAVDCIIEVTGESNGALNGLTHTSGTFTTDCPNVVQATSAVDDQPALEGGVQIGAGFGTPGFDVYPAYNATTLPIDAGAIKLQCTNKPTTGTLASPNTITIVSPNCPSLNATVNSYP